MVLLPCARVCLMGLECRQETAPNCHPNMTHTQNETATLPQHTKKNNRTGLRDAKLTAVAKPPDHAGHSVEASWVKPSKQLPRKSPAS
eukprot:172330-Rhodomonas_salina.1